MHSPFFTVLLVTRSIVLRSVRHSDEIHSNLAG